MSHSLGAQSASIVSGEANDKILWWGSSSRKILNCILVLSLFVFCIEGYKYIICIV